MHRVFLLRPLKYRSGIRADRNKDPAPTGDKEAPLQALIFDALYDSYKGVIVFCRIKEGTVKVGDTIRMMATVHSPRSQRSDILVPDSLSRVMSLQREW